MCVVQVLKGAGSVVKLSVQYKPDEYNRYEARLHEIQQSMTGTLVRTSPKRSLYVRALFDYDPPTMSPNPEACDEELPFREGQLIKVSIHTRHATRDT